MKSNITKMHGQQHIKISASSWFYYKKSDILVQSITVKEVMLVQIESWKCRCEIAVFQQQ